MNTHNKNKNKSRQRGCAPLNGQSVDYRQITEAIKKAYTEIEQEKEQSLRESEKLFEEEFCLKNYEEIDNKLLRGYKILRRDLHCIHKLIHYKKENIETDRMIVVFFKQSACLTFKLLKWIIYLFMILIMCGIFMKIYQGYQVAAAIICIAALYFCARILRIIEFEIEHLRNKESIYTVFSASSSIFAIFLAIIALFIG